MKPYYWFFVLLFFIKILTLFPPSPPSPPITTTKRQEKEALKEDHLYKHTIIINSLSPLLSSLYPTLGGGGKGGGKGEGEREAGEVGGLLDSLFSVCPIFEEENFESAKGALN